MKAAICSILLFVCLIFSIQAQSEITVRKVVYIYDGKDRVIDSLGNAGVRIYCEAFRIYYHCLYFSIQIEDCSILGGKRSPFLVRFKNINDTIPTYVCDSISQNSEGKTLIWVVAPFSEFYLPYEYEFLAQDIEQACNQMPDAIKESVDLMYYDIHADEYRHIECRNFSAPYYFEEKTIYHQICNYPAFVEDFEKLKTEEPEELELPDMNFDDDSFDE